MKWTEFTPQSKETAASTELTVLGGLHNHGWVLKLYEVEVGCFKMTDDGKGISR